MVGDREIHLEKEWPKKGLTGQVTFEQKAMRKEPCRYLGESVQAEGIASALAAMPWEYLKTGVWWPLWLELTKSVREGEGSRGTLRTPVETLAFPLSEL